MKVRVKNLIQFSNIHRLYCKGAELSNPFWLYHITVCTNHANQANRQPAIRFYPTPIV